MAGCLEDKVFRHFPAKKKSIKKSTKKVENVKLFCACRMPEDGKMICCDACQEWFHDKCVAIPKEALNTEQFKWYCKDCE